MLARPRQRVLVSDAERHRLLGTLVFPMTAAGLAEVINKTRAVLLLVRSGPGRSLPWTQPKRSHEHGVVLHRTR